MERAEHNDAYPDGRARGSERTSAIVHAQS